MQVLSPVRTKVLYAMECGKIKNGYCSSPIGTEYGKALSSPVFEYCSDAGG